MKIVPFVFLLVGPLTFGMSQSDQIAQESPKVPHCLVNVEFLREEVADEGGLKNLLFWRFKAEASKRVKRAVNCPKPGSEFLVYVPQGELDSSKLPSIIVFYPEFLKIPQSGERGSVRIRFIQFSGGRFKKSFSAWSWVDSSQNFSSKVSGAREAE